MAAPTEREACANALAASLRAAACAPTGRAEFHAVKHADWDALEAERCELAEKVASGPADVSVPAAVRAAGIDLMFERRREVKVAAAVARSITLLRRGHHP